MLAQRLPAFPFYSILNQLHVSDLAKNERKGKKGEDLSSSPQLLHSLPFSFSFLHSFLLLLCISLPFLLRALFALHSHLSLHFVETACQFVAKSHGDDLSMLCFERRTPPALL